MTAKRLQPFGTTIFAEMTRLANEAGAVNLAQGFPDFDGPEILVEAALSAMRAGENQYARSMGHPRLVEAVARVRLRSSGLAYDPGTEVVVFAGATEGIAAALIGILNPGDEAVLIEPFYDSYPAALAMAGAVPRFLTLHRPDFRFDPRELEALITPRTRLLLLNSPHNPTGRVFDAQELEAIAAAAIKHDLIVVTDEVYEHIYFDGAKPRPLASLDGMKERTLAISSAGKTYSMTGWKIGWALGPAALVAAAQAAHQFLTFAVATPLQVAVATALDELPTAFYEQLRRDYDERRRLLAGVLDAAGFNVSMPEGTYFIPAGFESLSSENDHSFARRLIANAGVAAIPPSPFYARAKDEGRSWLRFAFCKKPATLDEAARRLLSFKP